MMGVAPLLRSGVQRLSEIPSVFDALRWVLEGGYQRHRQLLARHFAGQTARVLDCGCGTGIYASCFPPRSYVGIDISATYIAHARRRYPAYEFQIMDATKLAFADDSFDAVMVCGVVHHLDEPTSERFLSEIARVLRPDGRLLLWEDVPTRRWFNIVGHIVHRLDVGAHIRPGAELEPLLQPLFEIEATESLRSGFMDYLAFRARKAVDAPAAESAASVVPSQAAAAHAAPVDRPLAHKTA